MQRDINYFRGCNRHNFIANAKTILNIQLDNMHTCTSNRQLELLFSIPNVKPLTVCILIVIIIFSYQ